MKTLPQGKMLFGRYTDAQLIFAAQSLHDGMAAEAVTFPAPPITLIAFQTHIDDFRAASATAWKATKADTATKKQAKQELINNMRSMITYVNQIVQNTYNTTPSMNYAALQALVLSAGVQDKQFNSRPNPSGNKRTPITVRTTRKVGGNIGGELYVRVDATKKFDPQAIKFYQLQYRLKATPVNDWITYNSTSSRISVTALPSGVYEYRVAGIAGIFLGKDQINWSDIQETVVT